MGVGCLISHTPFIVYETHGTNPSCCIISHTTPFGRWSPPCTKSVPAPFRGFGSFDNLYTSLWKSHTDRHIFGLHHSIVPLNCPCCLHTQQSASGSRAVEAKSQHCCSSDFTHAHKLLTNHNPVWKSFDQALRRDVADETPKRMKWCDLHRATTSMRAHFLAAQGVLNLLHTLEGITVLERISLK